MDNYIPLIASGFKFYADPFLFKYQGINYLFFEDYNYKKGVISYVTLDQKGIPSSPGLALQLPTHLSFPHLFEGDGVIYMTPETFQRRSISLFKSVQFPNQWKHERVLVSGEYFSDPIVFRKDGLYWLFAAIHTDELVIYYAKDLNSEFFPHPINNEKKKGRNAGGVFLWKGKLVRPVMNCTRKYGESMTLKEIVILTTEEFLERELFVIQPDWAPNLVGTHTFSLNEDFVVYDGQL